MFLAHNAERLDAIDALRGIAVCGILFVNISLMGGPIDLDRPLARASLYDPDWIVWWFEQLWVKGTMRGLLSILFGASFLLFMAKMERAMPQRQAQALFLRRLLWLFVFGVVNGTLLLWPGDILTLYAIAGLIILPATRWNTRRLVGFAAVLMLGLILGGAARGYLAAQPAIHGPSLEARLAQGDVLNEDEAQMLERWQDLRQGTPAVTVDLEQERRSRLGSYGDNLRFMTATNIRWNLEPSTLWWVLEAAAFMVIGMALFRAGLLGGHVPPAHYLSLLVIGYGFGVPLNAWEAWSDWRLAAGGATPVPLQLWAPEVTYEISRLLVTLGHVGLFHLLWNGAATLFTPFVALGRMALTCYLGQSILAALAFSGFGLGLWGIGRADLWLVALVILLIETAFALAWLSVFRLGPLEWLWRRLTYGRPPPLLRRPASVSAE